MNDNVSFLSYWLMVVIVVSSVVSSSCLSTNTTSCDNGRCPTGTTCAMLVDGRQGCVQPGVCGNLYIDDGEVCDDGNTESNDGCSANCQSVEICGNGFVDIDSGERCDCTHPPDGVDPSMDESSVVPTECLGKYNNDEGGLCRSDCRLHCGDGQLALEEVCEGGIVRTGFTCLDFGYDFGHMRCLDGCAGLDPSDCGSFDWRSMPTPTSVRMRSVWGSSAEHIYAVGTSGVIVRYDGSNWEAVTPQQPSNRLRDVWGTAADNIYAVGDFGTLLHFDGTAWSNAWQDGSPPATTETLFALWGDGPDEIVAVGESGTILFFDGKTWTTSSWSDSITLRAVWGKDADDIFAVGSYGLILHFDGNSWQQMTSPTNETLHSIWGTAHHDVYAVGDDGTIVHFDGSDWSTVDSDTSYDLSGIWGANYNDIFAVGDRGVVLRYDGDEWRATTSSTSGDLMAVWGTDDEVFAVGENGTLLKLDRVTWQVMDSDTSDHDSPWIRDVWGTTDDNVYAVGEDGLLSHYDGDDWDSVNSGTDANLRSIWGSGPENVFAVGECGTILQYDGSEWDTRSSPTSNSLYAIWGSGPQDIFAVGEAGTILYYNGVSWQLDMFASPTFEPLYGIWGSGPDDVWAVGENGTLLHRTSAGWTTEYAGTSEPLYGVWGHGPNDVFVVGENREVLHYDGTAWSKIPPPPPTDWLRGVGGLASDDMYIAGENGHVLHYDGVTWGRVNTGKTEDLYAIWMAPSGRMFVVGRNGGAYSLEKPGAQVENPVRFTCGDDTLEYGEACDDGNLFTDDGCDETCRVETVCGDGVLNAGESCDDGNTVANDGCDAQCRVEAVFIEDLNNDDPYGPFTASVVTAETLGSEREDPADDIDIYAIENVEDSAVTVRLDTYNATWPIGVSCNSSLDTFLQLRDSQGIVLASNDDRTTSDKCSRLEHIIPKGQTIYAHVSSRSHGSARLENRYWLNIDYIATCGDGRQEGLEECEDGNTTPGDGCDERCLQEYVCGDGVQQAREQCDDPTMMQDGRCNDDCTIVLPTATRILPSGGSIQLVGSIGIDDWTWARPTGGCAPTAPANHYYEVWPLINETGQDQRVTVTAEWLADGHLHAYADPFDPLTVNGCLVGNDQFDGASGSRLTDLFIAAGETVHIVASTFGSLDPIGDYTIDVLTQVEYQCL